MKKALLLTVVLFFAMGIFAQQTENSLPQAKVFSQQSGKYNFVLEYTPLFLEGRIFCSTVSSVFNEGEAMNVIIESLQKFMAENNLIRYKYTVQPKIKTDYEKKVTYYMISAVFESR